MVDDASPDGTQDVARQLAKTYGEDRVVSPFASRYTSSRVGAQASVGQAGFRVRARTFEFFEF